MVSNLILIVKFQGGTSDYSLFSVISRLLSNVSSFKIFKSSLLNVAYDLKGVGLKYVNVAYL